VPIVVPDRIGEAEVRVSAVGGGLTDAMERTLSIVPRGFPHRWTASGQLDGRATHKVTIDGALPGGTTGRLHLFPNRLSTLMDGMASMVRIPRGCFEQTSSSNYPNILVLRHLDRAGSDAGLAVDRTAALRTGYQRLIGFQVESGGFETFGRGPGKVALSAYGLLQFTDMVSVFPEVDADMISENVDFLLSVRDGSGGYRMTSAPSHRWGAAPKPVTDAFITWVLVQTGHLGAGPEVDRALQAAAATTDPYVLALSVLTLQHVDPGAAQRAAVRLAALQADDGSFPGAATSVVRAAGANLLVETGALAIVALHRGKAHVPEVTQAVRWLVAARRGRRGWGSTQATVMALKALDALAEPGDGQTMGSAEVWVDGTRADTVAWTGAEVGGVIADLGDWLTPGSHDVELRLRSGDSVPYSLEASWRRETPQSALDAPLRLRTSMAVSRVALGETVRLTAVLTNPGDTDVASPIARLGLPAGVRAETWQLEALRDEGVLAFFETGPREVTLYWEGFGPGQTTEIALDLVTEVPGTFTAPASSAYPYYDDDAKSWVAVATLDIRP